MSYSDVIRADAPVGYWPLNESSGTNAADLSGNGRPGTYGGGFGLGDVSYVPGERGGVSVSGGSVTIPDNVAFSPQAAVSGEISLEIICHPEVSLSGSDVQRNWMFTKGSASNYEWGLQLGGSGAVDLDLWNLAGSPTWGYKTVATYALNSRLHIIATWVNDGTGSSSVGFGTGHIYVNGVDQPLTINTVGGTWVTPVAHGTSPVVLGRRGDGSATDWRGSLAHAALYNRALTASDALKHYRAGLRQGVSY